MGDEKEQDIETWRITGGVYTSADSWVKELEEKVGRLTRDNWALRGALGYPVPGEYDEKLSDGSVPRCGVCQARKDTVEELRRELKAAGEEIEYQRGLMARSLPDVFNEEIHKRDATIMRLKADVEKNRHDTANCVWMHQAARDLRSAQKAWGEVGELRARLAKLRYAVEEAQRLEAINREREKRGMAIVYNPTVYAGALAGEKKEEGNRERADEGADRGTTHRP